MNKFKDFLQQDLGTFFNLDEFAEPHNIDGRILNIIVDNDRLMHRSKVEYEGVIVGDILYFAKAEDFPRKPKPDDIQTFDNVPCQVYDVREDMGMLEIILKRNGT